MKYTQYYNSIEEIQKQREKLDALEKSVKDEAYRDGLFSFELKELISEIESIRGNNIKIHHPEVTISVKVPEYCKDVESAKKIFNQGQHAIISTFLPVCGGLSLFTKLDLDTKLSDGTSIWNHITVSKGKNIHGKRLLLLDKNAQPKVMFNLSPDSQLLKNTTVIVAIENIIARREAKENTPTQSKNNTGKSL